MALIGNLLTPKKSPYGPTGGFLTTEEQARDQQTPLTPLATNTGPLKPTGGIIGNKIAQPGMSYAGGSPTFNEAAPIVSPAKPPTDMGIDPVPGFAEGEPNPNFPGSPGVPGTPKEVPPPEPPVPAPGPTPPFTPSPLPGTSPPVITNPNPSAPLPGVDAVTRTVDRPTETVQGQLESILGSGSPLLERAQAGAMQTANSRGLINSTMAAQAGQAALMDTALPIATADANIYGQAAGQNQQYQNQAAGQTADQRLKEQTARETNNMNIVLANADNATKTALSNIEAQYKVLMQGNASASDIYKSGMANISAILMNKDLDGAAKNAAIAGQLQMIQNGMALIGGMNGMKFTDANGNEVSLQDLLDFSKPSGEGSGGAGGQESPEIIKAREVLNGPPTNAKIEEIKARLASQKGLFPMEISQLQRELEKQITAQHAADQAAYDKLIALVTNPLPG